MTKLIIRKEVREVRGENSTIKYQGLRQVREVHPLGMRVLVRIKKDTNKSDTGLYLPEGAKQSKQESLLGEVIEVATAHDEEDQEFANISGIPLGALVLIPADAGIKVPWNDDLRIVETMDVLAVVEELDLI